jgi:hypothetical protein
MRVALLLSMALVATPFALAQSADNKSSQAKPAATAAKPAPKAADKATKVDNATTVRTTPADMKKSGKDYEGCGHGKDKVAASDA